MDESPARIQARQRHFQVAAYLALRMKVLDKALSYVVYRSDLERLIGLVAFKRKRITWMREDFNEFFHHVWTKLDDSGSLHTLHLANDRNRDPTTVIKLRKGFSFQEMVSSLHLITSGAVNPVEEFKKDSGRKK